MGRDIFVQDLPPGINSVAEIPDDFEPKTIGKRSVVIEVIKRLAPRLDMSTPGWLVISEPDLFRIEVSIGDGEELQCFAFHVAGGGEADQLIARILDTLQLRALDTWSESGLFHVGGTRNAP